MPMYAVTILSTRGCSNPHRSEDRAPLGVEDIFSLAQKNKLNHEEYIKTMKQLYQKMELKTFCTHFNKCLKLCLEHPESLPCIGVALDFASKFIVSLLEGLGEDETCPFFTSVVHFLFENHDNGKSLIRLRVCEFINRLLTDMGQDASLDDEMCEKIVECLLERIQDKIPKIRAQAVYALHRLQQPGDESCKIIKVFLFHMNKDPSHEVRNAIVQKIAVNKRTLPVLLKRVNDINDTVRKEAYKVLTKIAVQRFTVKQRQKLLSNGLKDRSETVKEYVRSVLLKTWLQAFDFKYTDFLNGLAVETNTDVVIMALKETFKYHHDVTLTLMLKEMYIENKTMPYARLSPESAVMWRAMAEFLHKKEGMEEAFEHILPDLTVYCSYIREYYIQCSTGQVAPPNEYILMQLMEMTKLYDLSDEVGRQHLRALCIDLLQFKLVTEKSAALISSLLVSVIPDLNERLNKMAEIISELREPFETDQEMLDSDDKLDMELKAAKLGVTLNELRENKKIAINEQNYLEAEQIKKVISETEQDLNELKKKLAPTECNDFEPKDDVETVKKCLTIVVTILQSRDLRTMTPTLRSLLENFILPCFQKNTEENKAIHGMALKSVGIFGLLDRNIAWEKFLMFASLIGSEDVGTTALTVVFDYLLYYGIKTFEKSFSQGSESGTGRENLDNFLEILTNLVDSKSLEIQNIAVSGFCKLLFHRRLTCPKLVAKLVLLWFTSNDTENGTYAHQTLGIFFSQFATLCSTAQRSLSDAFMIIVKTLKEKEYEDKLEDINEDSIVQLMLRLTQPRINRYVEKGVSVHNELAIRVCHSIVAGDNVDVTLLIRNLHCFQLDYSLKRSLKEVLVSLGRVIKVLHKSNDKPNFRLAYKYFNSVKARRRAARNPVNNTAEEEAKPDVSNIAQMEIQNITPYELLTGKVNGDDENEDDGDDEILSHQGDDDDDSDEDEDEDSDKDEDDGEDENKIETSTIPETPESSDASEYKRNIEKDDDSFDSEVPLSNFETPARNTRSRTAMTQRKRKHSTVKKRV